LSSALIRLTAFVPETVMMSRVMSAVSALLSAPVLGF
jgi:hypothetical protein